MEAVHTHSMLRDEREARPRTPLRHATGFEQHTPFGWVLVMPITMLTVVIIINALTMMTR